MNESVIVVPGDPEYRGTCITADTRPNPRHAWLRAASHCLRALDTPYFVRTSAADTCFHVADSLPVKPFKSPVKWGWGKGWPGQ